MLYADALRGFDATGVMGINKVGNVDIKKQAVSANYFTKTSKYKDFEKNILSKYQMVIGHNRYATKGSKESKDSHPFWDKDGKICLVHNGTITNQKDFCKEADVDSAAIANALAERDPKDVIENIDGAFALIWYDVEEKTMYFIRNDLRPLHIGENNDIFAVASEMEMMQWIGARNNIKYHTIHVCQPHKLYSIDLETRKFKEVEEIKKKYVPYIPPSTNTTATVIRQVITPTIHDYGDPSPALFLSDNDIPDAESAMRLLSKGESLNFQVDGYLEKENNVCIEGSIANITTPHVKLKWWVTKGMFDIMDLTNVWEVNVLSMTMEKGDCIIYCSRGEEQDTVYTDNQVVVTSNMWMATTFYNVCDGCSRTISWNDIKDSHVVLKDMSVELFTCPECTKNGKTSCASPVQNVQQSVQEPEGDSCC